MVRAVSFDLWDTLLVDGSDAEERSRRGLPSLREERLGYFLDLLAPTVTDEEGRRAWEAAEGWCQRRWVEHCHTPSVSERLSRALESVALAPGADLASAIRAIEEAEGRCLPRAVRGAAASLSRLASELPLVLLSDAIVTPGRCLRELLERRGLASHFEHMVFSDELGVSKPDRRAFEAAAAAVGVAPAELLHVGDREETDVLGARGCGAQAVLFVGAVDRRVEGTRADATCGTLEEVCALLLGAG